MEARADTHRTVIRFIIHQLVDTSFQRRAMGIAEFILSTLAGLHPSYGKRIDVDVAAQFIAPVATPVHSEGAMNRAPTLQITNGNNSCAGPVDCSRFAVFASWRISCSSQRMYFRWVWRFSMAAMQSSRTRSA